MLFAAASTLPIHGQAMLTERANTMRNADRIAYSDVEFCNPGAGGENATWDFSATRSYGTSHNVTVTRDSLGNFHKIEDMEKLSYILKDGALCQYCSESRLAKTYFAASKLAMKYPMQYGYSTSAPFDGYGRYCGDHTVRMKGHVTIEADGWGNLILSDRDTLRNALRIHTTTTTAMAMDAHRAEIDSANLKQEIEEKYEWYSPGFRYPVYTTIQKTSFAGTRQVGGSTAAFRLKPEAFGSISDAVNDSIRAAEKDVKDTKDIFHYHISSGNSSIDIAYSADTDADVTMILASSMGMQYDKRRIAVANGETGNMHINTAGLPRGQYIIYINVNGLVYSKATNVR